MTARLASVVLEAEGLGDAEARTLLRAAADHALGAREPDGAAIANLLLHLAKVEERLGAMDRAETCVRDALRLHRRACGLQDPRTRHAHLELANVLARAGKTRAALAAFQAHEPIRANRPAWLSLQIEALRRELGETPRATAALDDAARTAQREIEHDAVTMSGSAVQTARRLAQAGRRDEARRLLAATVTAIEDVIAGRRMSISARIPSQVLEEVREALGSLDGGD